MLFQKKIGSIKNNTLMIFDYAKKCELKIIFNSIRIESVCVCFEKQIKVYLKISLIEMN